MSIFPRPSCLPERHVVSYFSIYVLCLVEAGQVSEGYGDCASKIILCKVPLISTRVPDNAWLR